jgi:hypothetical protein
MVQEAAHGRAFDESVSGVVLAPSVVVRHRPLAAPPLLLGAPRMGFSERQYDSGQKPALVTWKRLICSGGELEREGSHAWRGSRRCRGFLRQVSQSLQQPREFSHGFVS